MASGPNISWQIDGETMEKVTDIILWGSKITADGDCSHEVKRCWLLVSREGNGTPLHLPGKIPWMEEPGGLQSTGLLRVRHN